MEADLDKGQVLPASLELGPDGLKGDGRRARHRDGRGQRLRQRDERLEDQRQVNGRHRLEYQGEVGLGREDPGGRHPGQGRIRGAAHQVGEDQPGREGGGDGHRSRGPGRGRRVGRVGRTGLPPGGREQDEDQAHAQSQGGKKPFTAHGRTPRPADPVTMTASLATTGNISRL